MTYFELERLTTYDDQSLIAEIHRVAGLVAGKALTTTEFVRHSKVHWSTIGKRFGSWRKALEVARLIDRYDDSSNPYTRDEIISALQRTAAELGRNHVTLRELHEQTGITQRPVLRVFGTFRAALDAAGLTQTPLGRRYTDEECFENLLAVWTALGRQPYYAEMKCPPSRLGPKGYVTRWGSWRKALAAFVERVNSDSAPPPETETPIVVDGKTPRRRTSREVPLGLRYTVLRRDRFRCVLCGRTPALHPGVVLHVDHFHPWSRGGETIEENLRTLCGDCNLGKGPTIEGP